MMSQWRPQVWCATRAWLVLPVLYLTAYAAILNPQKMYFCSLGSNAKVWSRIPNYRWKTATVERIFAPALRIDRAVRPGYWIGTDPLPGFRAGPNESFGAGGFGGSVGRGGFAGEIPNRL
jgi:hypothetical protein